MSLRERVEEMKTAHPAPWRIVVLDANGEEIDVQSLDHAPETRGKEGRHNFLRVATAIANE